MSTMPVQVKVCSDCGWCNHFRRNFCAKCGVKLKAGRPEGTTKAAGYRVSEGRPLGTTETAGYGVSEGRPLGTTEATGYRVSEGRPLGTTGAAGYRVSEGRPLGTTETAGYRVSEGRPLGTTETAGFRVSEGRPLGTTGAAGYRVSEGRLLGTTGAAGYRVSEGRPHGRKRHIEFDSSIFLPTDWDNDIEWVNVDEDLIDICSRRIAQQRTYNRKPLGVAVCYGCGHMLWTSVDGGHTFLVNKPSGMCEDDAPASAYLKAVPSCSAGFVYTERGNSKKERWYSCLYCKSNQIPPDQHVGDVFDENLKAKVVKEWSMTFPSQIQALANQYERGQTSLCGLFSDTVREAGVCQYRHMQGEVNAITKLDRHYHGLFGFLAIKDSDIWQHSPSPSSSFRIKNAIRWLHIHNHLYSKFFSQYETLMRFNKPSFINPQLLDDLNIPLEKVLEDEATAMAFPLDSKYFEKFPAIRTDLGTDVAGRQYPRPELSKSLVDLCKAKYGEMYLDCKALPHLHPWGHGGWYHRCPIPFNSHVKMRLFDIRGHFAEDRCYPFFKYDYMLKVRLRMHEARKVVKVQSLSEPLTAESIAHNSDPYSVYGTEIPRIIPGSREFWRSFGLDLVAFVQHRGLPDFFLTLTAFDGWPQVQATLRDGWGACATEIEVQDLAKDLTDRQPVGFKPQVSVLAAEKRFDWFMSILRSPEGGPLGIVTDSVVKKEYQRRGAVHWHMLIWVEPGSAPKHAVMAEMPRAADTSDVRAAYLRKLVDNMLQHKVCYPSRCFKGSHGKVLSKCKYGFPFEVQQESMRLDDEGVRYLYMRRHEEDKLVVPYNPEIAILWGAAHNVQVVSKHGFEMYLAKYISKPEPSLRIELPEKCSAPQKFLRTRVVGSVEVLDVLMGFHQNQMSRQVIYLQTELAPQQRMLKPKFQIDSMSGDSEDIYLQTKFESYLKRPVELDPLTYPEFYQWWRTATHAEQKKAAKSSLKHVIKCKGSDDFRVYQNAKSTLDTVHEKLADILLECDVQVESSYDLLALQKCLVKHNTSPKVVDAVVNYYVNKGIVLNDVCELLPLQSLALAECIVNSVDFNDPELVEGLSSYHWFMGCNPRDKLVSILSSHTPGTVLPNREGHYWVRRGKMVFTRHRFISSVGDDTEKYYQQKYLLTVPLTEDSEVVLNPPESWVELCARNGMCDAHLDALSCLQSAISRGFHTDQLRSLAQLYVEHGFLSEDEVDAFLSDIPVLGEHDEPETTVTDQILNDPQCDLGNLVPSTSPVDLNTFTDTFTESQLRAYRWVENELDHKRQVRAAVVGPAGTGKSYLLKGLIELAKTKGLVVTKLAPSGVAAHLIGGTTLHSFFGLDVECNCSLENGTVQVSKLRKTDVLVIDEFSMLDYYLFRTAEGLCRRFAKHKVSNRPWGGRHVIMLGDMAQLPAVGRRDLFGTHLWRTFSVMVLREVKRCQDPVLSSVLSKVRMGVCDCEVTRVLSTLVQPRDIETIELDRTIVICSTRNECDEINELCVKKMDGNECVYEAIDTDNHGHPLREADKQTVLKYRERLSDQLVLKVGARVVLRRNLNIEGGWVNGTLAVITSMHHNCIVVAKLANPSEKYPIPRFRQRIEIHGASYTILRQQFPLQVAYGVTVHRVQGCTVQKAVVCLGEKFFASGQAYVALSRVRTLQDLVLWEFHPSAIFLDPFYQQLLLWCDAVDVIRPIPPSHVVEHPDRGDYVSNAPIAVPCVDSDKPNTGIHVIQFSFDPSADPKSTNDATRHGRGRPRKENLPEPSIVSKRSRAQAELQYVDPKCTNTTAKRGRGRPRKQKVPESSSTQTKVHGVDVNQNCSSGKRGRGRPCKTKPTSVPTGKDVVADNESPSDLDSECKHDECQLHVRRGTKRMSSEVHDIEVRCIPTLSLCHNAVNVNHSCTLFCTSVHAYLGNTSPESVLSSMLSLNSVQEIIDTLNGMSSCLETIVQSLNALPCIYVDSLPCLPLAVCIQRLCHPLILQTYKPVVTTADGNCMYHALSRGLCGNEQLSNIVRLLTAYAIVKYRDVMIDALQDAFPLQTRHQHICKCNSLLVEALQNGVWGCDYHLFSLSLLLDRPIFIYFTFFYTDNGVRSLSLADCNSVSDFASRFHRQCVGTRQHILCCSSVNRVLLESGDVTSLPHLPLALFFHASHWTAMVPLSLTVLHYVPIPLSRVLVD